MLSRSLTPQQITVQFVNDYILITASTLEVSEEMQCLMDADVSYQRWQTELTNTIHYVNRFIYSG